MGNKNGSYEALSEETKDLLTQKTGKLSFYFILKYLRGNDDMYSF
jgi:hypothetical protein